MFLDGIAERGLASIAATARLRPLVKHILDCRTAIASVDGEPSGLGGTPGRQSHADVSWRRCAASTPAAFGPGDIFIMNDPFDGGAHVPCVWTGRPVCFDGARQALRGCWPRRTKSISAAAFPAVWPPTRPRFIRKDCASLPPLRLFENDEPVDAIFSIIALNVRIPDMVLGDIHGGIASLRNDGTRAARGGA